MHIVSLDPGGTTGVAVWNAEYPHQIYTGNINGANHHLGLWEQLCETAPDIVVCERFNYQRRAMDKGVSLEIVSREYIGVAHLWCQYYKRRFELQQPAQRMFWSDSKLKDLYFWDKKSPHERDAVRHLLAFLLRESDFKDEIRWFLDRARA